MKFDELIEIENSEKIGAISFHGHDMHLCDHIEAIDGKYYATAAVSSIREMDDMKKYGAPTATYPDHFYVAYLDEDMLKEASPKFNDSFMTSEMLVRVQCALKAMNNGRFANVA